MGLVPLRVDPTPRGRRTERLTDPRYPASHLDPRSPGHAQRSTAAWLPEATVESWPLQAGGWASGERGQAAGDSRGECRLSHTWERNDGRNLGGRDSRLRIGSLAARKGVRVDKRKAGRRDRAKHTRRKWITAESVGGGFLAVAHNISDNALFFSLQTGIQ